jgi:hypothetical protein
LKRCTDCADLELVGISDLSCCSIAFKNAIACNHINNSFCFSKNFDENDSFFYYIEAIKNERIVYYERGVGSIYLKDGRTFLNRHSPFAHGENANRLVPVKDGIGFPFNYYDDTKLVLYSTMPHSFFECLILDHSIIGCSDPCRPQPIQLKENSFLSRLDGDIESVDFEDDRLVDKITKIIAKFTKQLKLKTSKLTLKRIEPETIDMVPTSNVKAKRGSLYYDEQDDTLKIYNGQSWKTIAFLKD